MEYNDFEKQWQSLSDDCRSARCPKSDAELDREVRRALWDTAARPEPLQPSRQKSAIRPLRWVAAAACLLAVVIPLALQGDDADGIRTVSIDGEQVLFACNTGCSPDGTIETFKTYLR